MNRVKQLKQDEILGEDDDIFPNSSQVNDPFIKLYEEIRRDIGEVRITAYMKKDTKESLAKINKKILLLEKERIGQDYLPVRKNAIMHLKLILKNKFLQVNKKYMDKKDENTKDLIRKIKIVSPDISEDNLSRALRDPDKYMSAKILSNGTDTAILTAFETVKSKHEETLKLEADIKELNQMFVDFASIVENQGSILDVIEGQVISASDAIENANAQLEEATILKRQLQRRQCCCAMLCILLIVIIVGIILAVVYVQKKAHI